MSELQVISLVIGVSMLVFMAVATAQSVGVIQRRGERELREMQERHERERVALDNYATACRDWLYGDGTKEAADKAYDEYLKVCHPKFQKAPRS